jgi:hypothetical protein
MGYFFLHLPGIEPGPLSWDMSIFFSIDAILFIISIKLLDFLHFSNLCKNNIKKHYMYHFSYIILYIVYCRTFF